MPLYFGSSFWVVGGSGCFFGGFFWPMRYLAVCGTPKKNLRGQRVLPPRSRPVASIDAYSKLRFYSLCLAGLLFFFAPQSCRREISLFAELRL